MLRTRERITLRRRPNSDAQGNVHFVAVGEDDGSSMLCCISDDWDYDRAYENGADAPVGRGA